MCFVMPRCHAMPLPSLVGAPPASTFGPKSPPLKSCCPCHPSPLLPPCAPLACCSSEPWKATRPVAEVLCSRHSSPRTSGSPPNTYPAWPHHARSCQASPPFALTLIHACCCPRALHDCSILCCIPRRGRARPRMCCPSGACHRCCIPCHDVADHRFPSLIPRPAINPLRLHILPAF